MKRFFLISQVFYPDEVSTANLFTNLCSKIAENEDIDVKVWCAQPSYSCLKRQPKRQVYKNIYIHYLASTNFKKDNLFGRLLNYLTFTVSVVLKLLFTKDKDSVFTHTTPPLLGIVIAFICKIKRRRFNYVLLDIFPDGLVRLGKMRSNSLFVRLWRVFYIAALKRCSYIVVIGRDMQKWLLEFCPEVSERVHYIPIWQDEKLINPIQYRLNPFVIENKIQDKFIVQYSGNMGLWNDMRTIGEAVNRTLDNVIFMFIGGGMRKKQLLSALKHPYPTNVMMIPFLANNDYAYSVSACHVALVSLREGLEGMAVPSKIIGIMAAGIPVVVVVPEESEIAYIIKEEDCGIVVKPKDVESLIQAILRLKNDPLLRMKMGVNGRNAFEKKYTTTKISEKYIRLLEQ